MKKKPVTKATKDLIAKGQKYYSLAYKPREVVLTKGSGSKVWDADGNDYIDLGSGISVTSLGHNNKKLIAALKAQAENIWHTSNIFFSEPAVCLAEELVKASIANFGLAPMRCEQMTNFGSRFSKLFDENRCSLVNADRFPNGLNKPPI